MMDELDRSLMRLLRERGGLLVGDVDISFEMPTREWASTVAQPTVNLYLYDMRENVKLREHGWQQEGPPRERKVKVKRRPVRIDLSYMVTCWTKVMEDQHRLLWHVLQVLMNHPQLPQSLLEEQLVAAMHEVRLEAGQHEGVFRSPSDFWGSLGNDIRPAINLLVTVDMPLDSESLVPIVLQRELSFKRLGFSPEEARERDANVSAVQPRSHGDSEQMAGNRNQPQLLEHFRGFGGRILDERSKPIPGAFVRFLEDVEGHPSQVGNTMKTDARGVFHWSHAKDGAFTQVVEFGNNPVQQRPLIISLKPSNGTTDSHHSAALIEDFILKTAGG